MLEVDEKIWVDGVIDKITKKMDVVSVRSQ